MAADFGYRVGLFRPKEPQERLVDRNFLRVRSKVGLFGTGYYFLGSKQNAEKLAKSRKTNKISEIDLTAYNLFKPYDPLLFYTTIRDLTILLSDLIYDENVNIEDKKVQEQLIEYSQVIESEVQITENRLAKIIQNFLDDILEEKNGDLLSNRILKDYDGIDVRNTELDDYSVGSLIFNGKLKVGTTRLL